MRLKTFETFDNGDTMTLPADKIYIIGIPSGEALQVTRDALDDLVCLKLVHYTMKYSEIGFFAFDDKDLTYVNKYVDKPLKVASAKKKVPNDITIINSDFDQDIMDAVFGIIDAVFDQICVDIYVQDNFMGITYGDYYLEIEIKEKSPKYKVTKSCKEKKTSEYTVPTNKLLIDRIEFELGYK